MRWCARASHIPGVRSRYQDVDLVIVRENTEDLYAGIEFAEGEPETLELIADIERLGGRAIRPDAGISIKPITIFGTQRVFRFAFQWAIDNGRHKVTAVHKANIMKHTDGLWLRVAEEVSKEFPQIEFEDRIVDNMAMQLVQKPELYDVMVMPNLYGDILSDLCAGLTGGLGLAPGANTGDDGRGVRGHARQRAEVRGPEQGEPDGDDAQRRAHAAPHRRGRRRRPPGAGDRPGDRRGPERHLRHEAGARRSDRRRARRRSPTP